ncbi:hypothetical protein Tco_1204912 [Tanacetum coccineum]
MTTNKILRVIRIILVVLPEHQSDTYVFTMKMEILSVSTSNSIAVFLMVAAASRGRVRFIATCSYPTDICKDTMKAQVHVSKDFRYSDTARLP